MGVSTIEWCHFSFNPWIGCQEVSAACDNCYARVMNARWGWVEGWGPHGERRRTSEANWKAPLRWSRLAASAGERRRVFCASLADVFDNQVPAAWRLELWALINQTPALDWLLLTKRPENVAKMLPHPWRGGWPNVWLGFTAEDQEHLDRGVRAMMGVPAAVRFASYEPALGPITRMISDRLDWVICGGESGAGARHEAEFSGWARDCRDLCRGTGVRFFLKQMVGKRPIPADLMVRQFPQPRRAPWRKS